jgi:hypothetical protein
MRPWERLSCAGVVGLFRISDLVLRICFEFRISNFGFDSPPALPIFTEPSCEALEKIAGWPTFCCNQDRFR